MKKWIKEIVIMLFIIIVASSAIGYYRSMSVNSKLDILKTTTTLNGSNVAKILSSKKPLIVHFWGTWCPVCNQEVSTISKLAKSQDFTLLTVAVNSGTNEEIKAYMQKKGINFLVVNDQDGTIAKAFNVNTFPTTLFYSANRKDIIKDSGYTSYAGFIARIKFANRSNTTDAKE